jgi:hypothetical protein
MKNLWVDIYQLSLRIISNSLNLIYSDNAEILKNLVVILNKAATESKQAENSAVLLTYLSDIENAKKLVGTDAEQFNLTQSVVQSCCQIAGDDLLNEGRESHEHLALVTSANKFLKVLNEEVIVQYC